MKKLALAVMAAAALAACSKTEVEYSTPATIGFAPVTGTSTKAAMAAGTLPADQELGVWAYWDNDGSVENDGVENYTLYNDTYLANALFANKGTSWGGAGEGYPWPVNGALVFAGYTTPGDDVLASTAVSYDLATDVMTFTGYTQADEFDLCWFGRTANSYNNRVGGEAVSVELSHALTWLTFCVYGEGSPVDNWKITSMTLKDLAKTATGTCKVTDGTASATWAASENDDFSVVFEAPHTIAAPTVDGEKKTGAKLADHVVIPSIPVALEIAYKFKVNGVEKTDTKTVVLKLNEANTEAWKSGVHYTYTLVFKANEILLAPSYGDWATSDQTVTVQ